MYLHKKGKCHNKAKQVGEQLPEGGLLRQSGISGNQGGLGGRGERGGSLHIQPIRVLPLSCVILFRNSVFFFEFVSNFHRKNHQSLNEGNRFFGCLNIFLA